MDATAEYISMCRKAPEIQGLWKGKKGDWYVDEADQLVCLTRDLAHQGRLRRGFWVVPGGKTTRLVRFTWLPRHDQLMELAQPPGARLGDTIFTFYEWTKREYAGRGEPAGKVFISVEKIWFAFVMHTRFGKLWNGREWRPAGEGGSP